MSFTTTRAPASASPSAMPRPMPRPAPVTIATCPSSIAIAASFPLILAKLFQNAPPVSRSAAPSAGRDLWD